LPASLPVYSFEIVSVALEHIPRDTPATALTSTPRKMNISNSKQFHQARLNSTSMIRSDHENYDHYSSAMINRLDGFFGKVDERLNVRIASWIFGQRVLEIGCGFGQLVEHLRKTGYSATGIDMLEQFVLAGQRRFPQADLRVASSEQLDFADGSVDTVILKDTIHHVYGEADIHQFLMDVKRVCRKRIIISDPNPTAILLLARKLIRHRDPVCSPEQAERAISKAGFEIVHRSFGEVLAFPLSGGFVGRPMVPNNVVGNMVLSLDSLVEKALECLRLHHHACWRYLLVADLE